MAEQESLHPIESWFKRFLLTWINRFSFFLAHHLPARCCRSILMSFGASSTVVGAVIGGIYHHVHGNACARGPVHRSRGPQTFFVLRHRLLHAGNFGYLWAPSILLMIPCRVLHGIGWSGCRRRSLRWRRISCRGPARRTDRLRRHGKQPRRFARAGAGFAIYSVMATREFFWAPARCSLLRFLLQIRARTEERKLPLEKSGHWLETIVVRETLMPAIAVAFLSFGQGGILTFLPIHAIQIGLGNPGHLVRHLCVMHTAQPADRRTAIGSNQPAAPLSFLD